MIVFDPFLSAPDFVEDAVYRILLVRNFDWASMSKPFPALGHAGVDVDSVHGFLFLDFSSIGRIL